jgi:hypothetical protein
VFTSVFSTNGVSNCFATPALSCLAPRKDCHSVHGQSHKPVTEKRRSMSVEHFISSISEPSQASNRPLLCIVIVLRVSEPLLQQPPGMVKSICYRATNRLRTFAVVCWMRLSTTFNALKSSNAQLQPIVPVANTQAPLGAWYTDELA